MQNISEDLLEERQTLVYWWYCKYTATSYYGEQYERFHNPFDVKHLKKNKKREAALPRPALKLNLLLE